ncbi:MAG: YIP1 family protein [Amaricoccus sp.]|uniref:YIP1 family protein n=1 Tax=Amaricoccus sp. TaxID=1872485 RepID=UPI0039E5EC72
MAHGRTHGGIVDAIARTWAGPRRAMAGRMAAGLSESRALADLMLACGLLFVASLPDARRAAAGLAGETGDPFAAAVAAHLFAWVALAPLAAYGVAALAHLVARLFGARGGFLPARSALFAALLAGTPVALGLALLGVLGDAVPALLPVVRLVGYAGVAAWLWLAGASLLEAEGFRAGASGPGPVDRGTDHVG